MAVFIFVLWITIPVNILFAAGCLLITAGIIIYFFHDKLNWIGRLPGDIRIEKGNFRFYFPITTMILFSLLAAAIIFYYKKMDVKIFLETYR